MQSLLQKTGTAQLQDNGTCVWQEVELELKYGALYITGNNISTKVNTKHLKDGIVTVGKTPNTITVGCNSGCFALRFENIAETSEWQKLLFDSCTWDVNELYEMGEQLGSGNYGEVFAAKHIGTKRRVAIKMVPRDKVLWEDEYRVRIRSARRYIIITHCGGANGKWGYSW